MRLAAFIISLLLLAGAVQASQSWLVVLAVLTGMAALRPRLWAPLRLRPALDLRLAAFVLAALLAFEAVDPTREWLIALSAVTGAALCFPGIVSLDADRRESRSWSRRWRRGDWQVWLREDWP